MTYSQSIFLIAGSLFGLFGVMAGAFGAHLLKSKLTPVMFETFEVAVRYQMYHALALIAVVTLLGIFYSPWLISSACLFILGIIIFSGSLYILVLSDTKAWGAVTPIGGLLLIFGWISLFLAGLMKAY